MKEFLQTLQYLKPRVITQPRAFNLSLCRRGFTLIELIIVVAILMLLALISIPLFSDVMNKAKVTRATADIGTLNKDIAAYFTDFNVLPDDLDAVGRANLLDPWGRPYQYYNIVKYGVAGAYKGMILPGNTANTDFDLYSLGINGATGKSLDPLAAASGDDVVRASDGSFIGLAEKF